MAPFVGRILRAVMIYVTLAVTTVTYGNAAPFAAIVMDARSGEVLYEQNADSRLHPASLTKMMTLYIAFQEIEAGRLSLDTEITVSKHAAAQPPSRLGLKAGQKIKLRYLIRAAAVKSANDAATAIGEHIGGGSEANFGKRMTKTAKALGMRNSTFRNSNGLTTEGHLSSARDMTVLGRHLFYDFPQFYNIFSRRTADAGIAQVRSTNVRFLDGYEGADGIKTGYTVAAGFNLTASAKRGDKRVIATIFGGGSTAARNAKMVELMDLGFGKSRNRVQEKKPNAAPVIADEPLIAAAAPQIDTPDVEGGAAKTIRVSGAVSRSLRPKYRPGSSADAVAEAVIADVQVPEIPDPMAAAIAAGVESALAEAIAPPPPENSFEAQALAMNAPAARPEPMVEAPVEAVIAAVPAAPEQVAEAEASAAPAPAPGSLEAQALALASGAAAAETPALAAAPAENSFEAQAIELAAVTANISNMRPQSRPERAAPPAELVAEAVVAPPETVAEVAAPAPVLEMVAEAAPQPVQAPVEPLALQPVQTAAPVALAEVAPAAIVPAEVTAVETVSADATDVIDTAPTRRAPIFDSIQVAEAAPEPAEDLVVVSKSTSGGRAWGVAVGAYTSHYEAERALLKTGLTESATLNQGLRKVTQSGGKFRAAFLGLTQDQADLACRRIRARGVNCETTGPA